MQTNNLKYLKFVRFKEVERWDLKSLIGDAMRFRFPKCKLKEVLSKSVVEWVDIKDDDDYPILGVHAHGEGVYINNVSKGKSLTMKRYQKSKEMSLFYCKVRTVNGQWGIVFPEYANSYGSSNMQYLDIAYEKISPYYFMNLLKLEKLTKHWDKNAIGADGRHFTLETLMNLSFPLPTLTEQQALVSAYNVKIAEAEAKEAEAEKKSKEIEEYLLSELGASVSKTKMASGLNFIKFKDVTRWDVPFFVTSAKTNSRYRLDTIQSCINHFMEDENFKSLRTETYKFPQNKFHYIGMENIEKQTGILVDLPEVNGQEIKSQTISVPQGYFLYGKLRPYLNKYWVNDSDKNDIVCSSEFFVFSIKGDINTLFFKYVLSSRIVQEQIAEATSGARMPRITENIFKNINIPLPPLEIQNDIVTHISEQKKQVKQLKQEAKELRERALKDFENEIFG